MQWIAVALILGLAIGLRRKPGSGAHVFLVVALAVLVGSWYLALARSA